MSMQHAQYVLLFLVLAVFSDWFQILQSYTLLLKSPFLGPANTCTIYFNPHVHSLNLVISCGPSQLPYMLLIGNRLKLTASKHVAISHRRHVEEFRGHL